MKFHIGRVETISEKILRKFAKPKRKRDLPFSPITKYKFLECCKFYFALYFFFFEFQSLKKNCVFGLLDGLVSAGKWVLNFDLLGDEKLWEKVFIACT